MCKALDDLIEDGRNEGRSEGIEIGRQEGIQEGRQEGIAALISICREFGVGDDEIINRLMEKFSLSKEAARGKVVV